MVRISVRVRVRVRVSVMAKIKVRVSSSILPCCWSAVAVRRELNSTGNYGRGCKHLLCPHPVSLDLTEYRVGRVDL